ncbi:MAG: hypothetical protein MJ175_09310 [Clostridia bacterium]|nr:hypothetical protein [Clostridia bacterium]
MHRLLSFALNLIFRYQWLIAAGICCILHFAVGLPLWCTWVCLGAWILSAVLVMLGFDLLHLINRKVGSAPQKPKENKNPYSNDADKKQDR